MKLAANIVALGLLVVSGLSMSPTTVLATDYAYGPETCRQGYVWREASPNDFVCVTPDSRSRVRQENAMAGSRRDVNGAYGSATCIQGYVWREAFDGDVVCVTPDIRALTLYENSQAAANRLRG